MNQKKKLLMWSDFGLTGTGFATVSKYVIKGLVNQFDIDHLAINYNGEFFDQKEMPVQVSAAKLLNPSDPFGNDMFKQSYLSGKYDFIWVMNDTFVVHKTGTEIPKLKDQLISSGKKVPKLIYYFPVDCSIDTQKAGMLEAADYVVAYCKFGKEEALKAIPSLAKKMSVITHGADSSSFFPIKKEDRQLARSTLLNASPDDYIWINVNRNSSRKDIAKSIWAFSEFKKEVPKSKFYIHTAIRDNQFDLSIAVKDAGLNFKDVIFPKDYFAHKPVPIRLLNSLYNCADAFITTTMGEGWGLTHIDALAAGVPVVAPNNTCFPEQLTGRGYLYPCVEKHYVDNQGYRDIGRIEDIVNTMKTCYSETNTDKQKKLIANGVSFVNSISWDKIQQQWLEIFKKVESLKSETNIRTQII